MTGVAERVSRNVRPPPSRVDGRTATERNPPAPAFEHRVKSERTHPIIHSRSCSRPVTLSDVTQPPIIPGSSEPFTLSSVLPVSQPAKRRWPLYAALALIAAIGIGGGTYYWALNHSTPASGLTSFKPAVDTCHGGNVADGGKTLLVKMSGRDGGAGNAGFAQLDCLLKETGAPGYVSERIGQTRAIDGQVTERWGNVEATWTYHPDSGLNLIMHFSS